MIRRRLASALVLAAALVMWGEWMDATAADLNPTAAEYDRPAGNPHQSRSATIAKNGIVATVTPRSVTT